MLPDEASLSQLSHPTSIPEKNTFYQELEPITRSDSNSKLAEALSESLELDDAEAENCRENRRLLHLSDS